MAGGLAARAADCGGRQVDDFVIAVKNRVSQASMRILRAQDRVIPMSGRAVRTVERTRSVCAAAARLRRPLAGVAKSLFFEIAQGAWGEA